MQYWILKLISRILCLLPYRLLLKLGSFLGRIYYIAARPQRERALTQIQERLNQSPAEATMTIRRLFSNLAQTFLEVLYMPRLNKNNISDYVTIENRHYLDAAVAEGKGVAILAAHLGNWEWLGAALALNGYPVASIIKMQRNDQHSQLINEYRRQAGIELFAKGSSDVISAVKALKRGCVLGFFSDQNAGKTGITLDFFGKPSSTHSGISVFAAKLGCPVVPVFIVRTPEGGHRILVQPPHYFEHSGQPAEDITAFTAQMSQIIENVIRQYPEQWLWFHRRWRNPYNNSRTTMSGGASA